MRGRPVRTHQEEDEEDVFRTSPVAEQINKPTLAQGQKLQKLV